MERTKRSVRRSRRGRDGSTSLTTNNKRIKINQSSSADGDGDGDGGNADHDNNRNDEKGSVIKQNKSKQEQRPNKDPQLKKRRYNRKAQNDQTKPTTSSSTSYNNTTKSTSSHPPLDATIESNRPTTTTTTTLGTTNNNEPLSSTSLLHQTMADMFRQHAELMFHQSQEFESILTTGPFLPMSVSSSSPSPRGAETIIAGHSIIEEYRTMKHKQSEQVANEKDDDGQHENKGEIVDDDRRRTSFREVQNLTKQMRVAGKTASRRRRAVEHAARAGYGG
eukprot:CAMPEP_0198272746 /NCGR_PEP_ID=MMETSP1447-20131203/54374_1 /TAXON_ID=420782 /ORGANISM="Chaetoceros dichaeta, Strain CCMP1751" /LENGTH=277 /DNA_ID=CAMNT_0043966101 /DNA_START=145 /DNA_END=978 /DNA_ORIENTATION=-